MTVRKPTDKDGKLNYCNVASFMLSREMHTQLLVITVFTSACQISLKRVLWGSLNSPGRPQLNYSNK